MDARQEYNENASFEEALSAIVVRRSYEDSNQRDQQYEQTPEQHFDEEPDTPNDSSNDVANLEDEMDTGDEGNEYMSDVLEDLSDGKSDSQPEEDSEESDDQDDEMSIDDEVEETSEGPSDSEQGEEIEQQGLHPAVPQGPTTQEPVQTEEKVCICCILPTTMANRLPCGHDYCLPCLITAVELSLSCTWHFPLQCCNMEVPPEDIEGSLLANDIQQYREKWTEHTTMNRTYCSNSQCLKFIPPNNTSDEGTPCYGDEAGCPVCNEITCTKCKNKGHTGDCEQQVGPAQALVLAETKGWKRCLRCGHLIELADGCSHMSMSPNQLVNLSKLLTYASQYVFAVMSSATSAVRD